MRFDPPNIPIAVTGMHRSGTSMITRALHDSGLHLIGTGAEELIDAAEDNPEGFWENKAIVACNDELLEATGGAWDNPPDLAPQAVDDARVAYVAEAATAAVAALSEHDHWGFKDPRTCLTAAYWLDLVPDLHFIVCVRHPLEVALSLKRRNQNSYSLGLELWERYYAAVLDTVPADRLIVTHYDTFFVDPEDELGRLCAFAGLTAAPSHVRSDLRHHTIGVGLGEAGVSSSLRALYADLCRRAGAPQAHEPPVNEGRVRRLILDGAVAQRHADQRQDAIERLQEREVESRAEHSAAEGALRGRIRELEDQNQRERSARERDRIASETKHRDRVRDLEHQVLAARRDSADRVEALQAETVRTIRTLRESMARTEAAVEAVHRAFQEPGPVSKATRRLIGRPARRLVGKSRRVGAPAAKAAVHQLPPPTQQQLRRVRQLVRRAIAEPVPTAKAVRRRLEPTARAAAKRLPPPAQQRLRRGRTLLLRAKRQPVPTAKVVARRLPPPLQQLLRRARQAAVRLQSDGVARVGTRESAPKTAPPTKGPAFHQWKDAYAQMVAAAVPEGESWLVVAPGSPKEALDARKPRATPFPDTRKGRPFASDLAHIAHLEALRFAGHRHLVVPEGSRGWFRDRAELRDHVAHTYRTVVDRDGAGAVFDLTTAAVAGSTRSLRAEVTRLAAGLAHPPAVLDWTDLDLARELPGLATFRPPAGDRLPYLDASVDFVVVDENHDLADAHRVASVAVITVAEGSTGLEIRSVESAAVQNTTAERAPTDRGPAAPAVANLRVLVWSSAGDGDDTWRRNLAERATAAGADLRIGEIDAAGLGDPTIEGHDVVVVVEPGVLPLPGAIETAAALAATRPGSAIAAKVLRSDGRLEAAGGMVFFDRSVALIAEASPDVRAPWHDFVRPVCWAPGLVAAASTLWASVPGPGAHTGRAFLREWCAEVWARGGSVVYQPGVTAVRVAGDGGEASVPLLTSSWQRVLDLRPNRPPDLSDGAWRYILAHDDVEACRG